MCVTTPIAAVQMAGPELTVELAQELFRARRLKELIGVAWDATPQDIKAAGKRTLLTHHPDKGGDPELFKIVQPAVVLLQREEYLYAFPGVMPDWAKAALCTISSLRDEQARHNARLEALRAQFEAAHTDSSRTKVRNEIAKAESAMANAAIELQHVLHMFGMSYTQHVESEHRRQQQEAERRERAAVERAHAELADIRAKRVIQRRKQRKQGSYFPTMPNKCENPGLHRELATIGKQYRLAREAAAKRRARGTCAKDLDDAAADLLKQGRLFVASFVSDTQLADTKRIGRFPRFSVGHQSFDQAADLRKKYTKLKDRLRHAKNDDLRDKLQAEVDSTLHNAFELARQHC